MKEKLENLIKTFIKEYSESHNTNSSWKEPLIAYADASDVDKCVNNALKIDSFDRHKCYEMCLINDKFHSDLGLVDVCGKCLVGVPCSTKNPTSI